MEDVLKPSVYSARRGQLCSRRATVCFARAALAIVFCLLWGAGPHLCQAVEKSKDQPLFLVARDNIVDPYFERSVVLMVPIEGQPVIVGLVVNKPTKLPLVEIFPKSSILKNSTEHAYLGGPVDVTTPSLVFHAEKPPKEAMLLYDDVYLSFDAKFIAKFMQDSKQTGDFRLFLGRAQWAPEQLQREARQDSWYSLRAEGDVIFEHDSEQLWKKLNARARPPLDVRYPMLRNGSSLFRVSAPHW